MSDRVQKLEDAVKSLGPAEYKAFSAWFLDYDQLAWEKQIEADSKSGKLDFLIDEARKERQVGKLKEL